MKAKLQHTNDYDLFEMHECNRDLQEKPILRQSMLKHGFMPSRPIQCMQNGDGKLKVISGHHRLHYARRLGLEVFYIIDDSNTDIFDLEADRTQGWSITNIATARAKAGDVELAFLLEFQKEHGLALGVASSLVGGESAGSYNKVNAIKHGTFKRGNMVHANNVVRITDTCRDLGVPFATASAFTAAVSLALRVPEFDLDFFANKVRIYPKYMNSRSRLIEYLEEIEGLYNYRLREDNRIPLQNLARKVGFERKKTFGR